MKGCVISGGGSWGAKGGGTLERINGDYDLVAGISTGALLSVYTALKKFTQLKEAYTSVEQKDIFNKNPFTKDGKIRVLNAIYRILSGKKTLGDTNALRSTIQKFLDSNDYYTLQTLGKEVIVSVQNLTTEKIEHKSSSNYKYEDFIDWMWASASPPFVGSIIDKDGMDYTDGGMSELLALKYLIDRGCTSVDVIIHRVKPTPIRNNRIKNFIQYMLRGIHIMRTEIEEDDVREGIWEAAYEGCHIRIFWFEEKLEKKSLIFDKATMKNWWEAGFETAFNTNRLEER